MVNGKTGNTISTPMPKWLLEAAKGDLIISILWLAVAFYLNYVGKGPDSASPTDRVLFYLICFYIPLFPICVLIAKRFYPEREGFVKLFVLGPLAISILTAIALIAVSRS